MLLMVLMVLVFIAVIIISAMGLESIDINSEKKAMEDYCKIECK